MRFRTQNVTVLEECPKDLFAGFQRLFKEIFDSEFGAEREAKLATKKVILLQLAYGEGNEVYGFKLGYEEEPGHFYSWFGAVALPARNYGIASSLLFAQHDWCKANGYKKISTKTLNRWKEMLILNIRNDFQIVGTETDKSGETRIILEKVIV